MLGNKIHDATGRSVLDWALAGVPTICPGFYNQIQLYPDLWSDTNDGLLQKISVPYSSYEPHVIRAQETIFKYNLYPEDDSQIAYTDKTDEFYQYFTGFLGLK